ncbi:M56 family metallopeptidase [Foetidibacter luteolus]|uniref:M56 family metallopeptidase n=1 Tax=Foetidibacter luteolus TaxID=2608880 RepID=UPI00129A7F2A|nr:M56 family metallopeptidase [Foetidibacter luteolus]
MQALSHSAFLQALGYAIVNSLWQMALLWIVVVLLNSIFSFTSHIRYKIALGAQFAGFTWFTVTLQYYYAACAAAMVEIKELALNNAPQFIQPEATNFNTRLWATMLKTEQLLPYLSVAYLLLLCFLVSRWFSGYRQTQLIRKTGLQKIDVEWKVFVQRMGDYLGIEKKVRIFASTIVKSPLTIGFLKPVILIPVASVNHLTVQQLEAVILHELAHIKRADYLINLVQCIIEIALFFNPFSQLISRFIKKEREHSCDDWVLQFQYNPTMYAEALLQLAYMNARPGMAMNAAGHSKGDLLSRVRRMLNQKEKTFTYKHQLFAFLLMTFILTSIAWFNPAGKRQNTAENTASPNTLQPVVAEPITAKVDNPLFNPAFFLNESLNEEIKKASETFTKHTTEIVTKSISAANESLAATVPAAMEAVSHVDLSQVENARELQEELAKANAEISKLNLSTLIDTLTINTAIRNEMAKLQMDIDQQKLNGDIQKAKAELSKLGLLQLVSKEDREKMKKSVADALKQVENLNWNFEWSDKTLPAAPKAAPQPRQPAGAVSVNSSFKRVSPVVRLRNGAARQPAPAIAGTPSTGRVTIPDGAVIIADDDNSLELNVPNGEEGDAAEDESDDITSHDAPVTWVTDDKNGGNKQQWVSNANMYFAPEYKSSYNLQYNVTADALTKAITRISATATTKEQKIKLEQKLKHIFRNVKNYKITERTKNCGKCEEKKTVVMEIVVYE